MLHDVMNIVTSVCSIVASVAAIFAGHKANRAYKLVRGMNLKKEIS